MTAPFKSDTESIIAETHGQVVRARATHPSFDRPMVLDLEEVSLGWDETRAPRVTANLTVKVPDALSGINALDPRSGVRVEIEVGYVRPGGVEDAFVIADLGLREVTINRPDDTMSLACTGDESVVIDGSPAASASVTGTTTSEAIINLLKQVLSPAPIVTSEVAGPAVTVDPIEDRYDAVKDLADRINAQVFDDGLRQWYIKPTATAATTAALTLKVGEGGTLLKSDDSIARDDWYNYVLLRYRWRDASDVDKQILATAYIGTGPYSITGPAGKKILLEDREVQTTQAEANSAAVSILQRTNARARSYSLTAVAAYWLRPGMTISVTLPGQTAALHLVQRVNFKPLDGTMDLDTRLSVSDISAPDYQPQTTTPPVGSKVADPLPPVAQTYVSSWLASASQTYWGDGSKNTVLTTQIKQGYDFAAGSQQQSLVLFNGANSTGSETAKTVTQALAGASISKVEIWLYAEDWYFDTGTTRLGFYNGTTIPTTLTGDQTYIESSGWPAASGRWVTITSPSLISALRSGSSRGITVGPGLGTGRATSGTFTGATASANQPLFKITYSK